MLFRSTAGSVVPPRQLGKAPRPIRSDLLASGTELSIIALIATFVGPRLFAQLDRSRATSARIQMQSLAAALETLRLDIGRYPSNEEGFVLLVEEPSDSDTGDLEWRGPYLDGATPTDPWGAAYVYEAPANAEGRPRLLSYGADRAPGGEGAAKDVIVPAESAEAQ